MSALGTTASSRFAMLYRRSARRLAVEVSAQARRIGRRRRAARRPASRATASQPVGAVDDPDGAITLMRVAGPLDLLAVGCLRGATARYRAGHAIHLDLQGTPIAGRRTVDELAVLLDDLEQRRIAVRVTGLDPHLTATPPRRG